MLVLVASVLTSFCCFVCFSVKKCAFSGKLFFGERRKRVSHFVLVVVVISVCLDGPCFALALGRVVVALELEGAVNVGRLLESASTSQQRQSRVQVRTLCLPSLSSSQTISAPQCCTKKNPPYSSSLTQC